MNSNQPSRASGLALPSTDGFAVWHDGCRGRRNGCAECVLIAAEIRREERGIVDELAMETRHALRKS